MRKSIWMFLVALLMACGVTPYLATMVWTASFQQKDESQLIAPLRKARSNSKPIIFALMTEPRCVPAIPFVLQNALERLPPTVKVVLFHSHHNAKCVNQWVNETSILAEATSSGRLVLSRDYERIMDPLATDVYSPKNWNNVLYRNVSFWQSLYRYGTTALTIQTDTLICGKPDNSTYKPPWHVNFIGGISSPITKKGPTREPNHYHLNGGLSIRKLDWVIACLQTSNYNIHDIVEDAVYNNCTQDEQVSVLDAMEFASDFGYTKCVTFDNTRTCPWGVHKPWMYTHGNYLELVKYCPEIIKLQHLVQYSKHSTN